MRTDVFIRRNGLVIGVFDREEFFNARTQGGILDRDEWMEVGGDVWKLIGSEEPFLSRSEEKRKKAHRMERMIAEAMNDSYNFKVWYSRVSHRAELHDSPVQPDAPALVGRSFLSSVKLAGFGAFSEAITVDFVLRNPDVLQRSPLCSEWLCRTGLGKTSLCRAIEMVCNVSKGMKLRREDSEYLHKNVICSVALEFQFIDGIDSANLLVRNGVPSISASPRVRQALDRIKFVTEGELGCLNSRDYLEPEVFEIIRSGWLGISPGFPVLDKGILDADILRRRLANPRMSERILAELLLLLHEAEANELTLVLDQPFACLDLMAVKDALKYLADASLRGANQVLLLNDANRAHLDG
jgi:hypothetical protein